jgi:hypothetical protein
VPKPLPNLEQHFAEGAMAESVEGLWQFLKREHLIDQRTFTGFVEEVDDRVPRGVRFRVGIFADGDPADFQSAEEKGGGVELFKFY